MLIPLATLLSAGLQLTPRGEAPALGRSAEPAMMAKTPSPAVKAKGSAAPAAKTTDPWWKSVNEGNKIKVMKKKQPKVRTQARPGDKRAGRLTRLKPRREPGETRHEKRRRRPAGEAEEAASDMVEVTSRFKNVCIYVCNENNALNPHGEHMSPASGCISIGSHYHRLKPMGAPQHTTAHGLSAL